ncbi:MAG TPA: molybdopterin-dependent oxidoreductase, partial [Labilithrix sp.]|nr:molybdopterin-dependent oxidoreductase [Labilithrix sp.]
MAIRTHHRACNLCEAMCGVRIEVDGDRVASIRPDEDDPFSQGYMCPKAVGLKDLHEDPDRLRHPVRRTASGWERMSWDDALDFAARGLHDVQVKHGREAVGAYLGNPTIHNTGAMLFAPTFLRALRTKNRFSATSVDQLPHMLAAYWMLGHQLVLPIPDVDRTQYFLVFGANPLASNGSLMTAPGIRRRIDAIRARGGRVVVVDPRRTETAERADEHVFVRPGTDALLLLGMLHVVFERGVKLGRLESFTDGLETLRGIVRDTPPERVAVHTGVPADVIRRLATEFASAPSAVCYGRVGMSMQSFGTLCQWLVNALNIVTGNFDRPGGAMFPKPAFDPRLAPKGLGVSRGSYGRWTTRVRGLPEFGGELPVSALGEEILTEGKGQIRGMVTIAGNPVLSTPNGTRLDEAFSSLEFFVAIDPYVNETSRHAHVILPPPSPLERSHYDVVFHMLAVRETARYAPAVFEKSPDARHDWQIMLGLARRLEELRS